MRVLMTLTLALMVLAATGKMTLVVDALKAVHNSGSVFDAAKRKGEGK